MVEKDSEISTQIEDVNTAEENKEKNVQNSPNGPRNVKGSLKKLFEYTEKYKIIFIIAIIFSIASSIITVKAPDKISELVNEIQNGLMGEFDITAIKRIIIFIVILYLGSAMLKNVTGICTASVTQKVSERLRKEMDKKINLLPLSYFHKVQNGDILSRVVNDVDMISSSLSVGACGLISAITMFLGSILMMLLTNGLLTLTAIGSTILGSVLMVAIMGKSQKLFLRKQENLGKMNGYIEEIYSGHMIIKSFSAEKHSKQRFDSCNNELKDSEFKAECLSTLMMPLTTFVGNFGYVSICVVGSILTVKGKIPFGDIAAFLIYVNLFTSPLAQIGQYMPLLLSTLAAVERVFEFLNAEEMESEDYKKEYHLSTESSVKFCNVRFGYEGTEKTVINNFSAEVSPGQKIAIVGPTGAGKTTLVNLLMRFYEILDGDIKIGDVSIKDMTRKDLRKHFSMVLQDTWLFEGTVYENLVYSTNNNISREALDRICETVGLDQLIKSLPNGYDTVIDDKLILSSGQKQQMTIARAMVANRPMLILDEATSSVDTRLEIQIQNAMDALMRGRTSFIIAHRLSTIKNADLILVMKDGDIIEKGTHSELIEQDGFYKNLYYSQFDVV